MENNTDKQMQRRNTETESHKPKLITEFTPSTGLHLRVPLHWVPIQLIPLKWYKKMVLETTSATVNRMLYKVFKTSLLEITISLRKAKKS